MILIISDEYTSTNQIMDWLYFFNQKYIRVSLLNPTSINIESIEINNFECEATILYKDTKLKLSEVKGVLIRHGYLIFWNTHFVSSLYNNFQDTKPFLTNINEETKGLNDFINNTYIQSSHNRVGNQNFQNVNKLHVLNLARIHGILIPDTVVACKKEKLITFFDKHNQLIISKAISQTIFSQQDEDTMIGYTLLIDKFFFNKIPENFPPTLFQNCVEKLFELRIFYIMGEFYTTAIFSQNDEQTKVDFRRYNDENQNRILPYKLPNEIEEKLNNLMQELDLKTGSIDMILDKNYNYIFLEVNPVGQFGYYSDTCNYKLEKKVAYYLTRKA